MNRKIKIIDDYMKLFNIDNDYRKYYNMFSNEISVEDIFQIIPEAITKDFSKFIEKYESSIDYKNVHEARFDVLSKLESSFLDTKLYNLLLIKEKNETLKNTLKSFKTSRNNQIKVAEYNCSSTSTGRLVVKEGFPSILTLPKRYRNIFVSKWKDKGSLIMVDFSSLEPRIAKKLTSKENYIDIYEEIKNLTEDNLDRSVIKRAVISTLYGSSTSLDNISKEKTEKLQSVCKEFFNYKEIYNIANNGENKSYRMNYFGRPIWNKHENRENIVVNNYIQSTAVDISLLCFNKLIDKLKTSFCRPVFVIHDAIIFDVHNDEKESFVNSIKQGYNCDMLGYFPLEITNFMET